MSTELSTSTESFDLVARMAAALAKTPLLPEKYRNDPGACLIAIEIGHQLKMPAFMVMQHLNIIKGKPSWSATFLVAAINASPRFSSISYREGGEGDQQYCVAYATDRESGELCESVPVSIGTAKAEGWYARDGSKWKTLPELMLRYRAASFFARQFAPELTLGFQSTEELHDMGDVERAAPPAYSFAQVDEPAADDKAPEVFERLYEPKPELPVDETPSEPGPSMFDVCKAGFDGAKSKADIREFSNLAASLTEPEKEKLRKHKTAAALRLEKEAQE